MSTIAEEIKAIVREAVREALQEFLAKPAANDSARLLDVDQAAQRLGLKRATVYKRARRGDLPSVGLGTRVLFKASDLDAYVEARRRSPQRMKALAAKAA